MPEGIHKTTCCISVHPINFLLNLPAYELGYRDKGDGWGYLVSGRPLHANEQRVPELHMARVRIVVRVEDMHGRQAEDERWVMVRSSSPAVDAGTPGTAVDAGI